MTFTTSSTRNVRKYWPAGPTPWTDVSLTARRVSLPPPRTAAARAGLRFQDESISLLERLYADTSWHVLSDLWFEYSIGAGKNIAGPDCLLINPREGWLVVLEYKLTNTNCYKQLFLYMSLLRRMLPIADWKVAGFLIYKDECRLPVVQSGPSEILLCDEIDLRPFAWDGTDLPLIGILPAAFIPLPLFTGV